MIISNFVIVCEFEIDFYSGMIVIIGEIGVGKFIVIDVFGFCFGGCVEVDMVCIGVVCVDLCVCFFLKDMLVVLCWLEEN